MTRRRTWTAAATAIVLWACPPLAEHQKPQLERGAPLVDRSVIAKLPEPARRHVDLLRSMADSLPAVCRSVRDKVDLWEAPSPGMGTALERDPNVLDLEASCAFREAGDAGPLSEVFAVFDTLRQSRGDKKLLYSCALWGPVSPKSPPSSDAELRNERERIVTSGCGPEAMKITEFRWLKDGTGVELTATIKVREANRLVDDEVIAMLPEVVKRNIGLIRSLADSMVPRCEDALKASKKLPSPAVGTTLANDPAVLQVEAACTFVWKEDIPVSKKHPGGNVEGKTFAPLRRADHVPDCPFWKLAAPESATPSMGAEIQESIGIPDEPRCKQDLLEVRETRPLKKGDPLKEGDVSLVVRLRRDSLSRKVMDH